jgi:hypothetical protein
MGRYKIHRSLPNYPEFLREAFRSSLSSQLPSYPAGQSTCSVHKLLLRWAGFITLLLIQAVLAGRIFLATR